MIFSSALFIGKTVTGATAGALLMVGATGLLANVPTSSLYVDPSSGDVGIGTTTPLATAHIAGPNQATGGAYNSYGNLLVTSTDAEAIDKGGDIAFGGKSGSDTYVYARIQGKKETSGVGNAQGYLAFETCNNDNQIERVRITSAGKLGVGTNNPSEFLHVVGSGILTGKAVIGLTALKNPKVDIVVGHGDGTTNEEAGLRLRGNSTDGATFTMQLGVNTTGVGGSNQGYGYIACAFWGGSDNNPLVLQPKGGAVGIATSLGFSDYKMIIKDVMAVKATAPDVGIGGRLVFGHYDSYVAKSAFIAGYYDKSFWYQGLGLVFHTVASGDISGSTGIERLRISSDGNVGIGVTSPDTILDIAGAFTQREVSAEPSDPDEGAHVIWQTDGTGAGDDGDIMMKITVGGVTKTVTLVDYSAA